MTGPVDGELPEPRTPAEFRARAELLAAQAAALPRIGYTLMSMALREAAFEMLAEADRLESSDAMKANDHRASFASPADEEAFLARARAT